MEHGEPALKPEWLRRPLSIGSASNAGSNHLPGTSSRSDEHVRGGSLRSRTSNSQSSSRRGLGSNGSRSDRDRNDRDGSGKSHGYASFGRSSRDKDNDRDQDRGRDRNRDFELRDKEISRSSHADNGNHREGFESFSSCRPERERMGRTRLKAADTLTKSGVIVEVRSSNGSSLRSSTGGSTFFDKEFPDLSSMEKNGKSELGRVPSPGISPVQRLCLIAPVNGFNSVLAEVPILKVANGSVSSSVYQPARVSSGPEAPSTGTGLSMAETVVHAPSRVASPPEIDLDAQKIEERFLRQCTLRPKTPSATKVSVLSSSDKLKTKGGRSGEPIAPPKSALLSSHPVSSNPRAPIKTEIPKAAQAGGFQVLSREQNGTTYTPKDLTVKLMSPVAASSASAHHSLENPVNKKPKGVINGLRLHLPPGSFGERRSNPKDRLKFFESLRRKPSNYSNNVTQPGCDSSSSGLVDPEHNSSLNHDKDFLLTDSVLKPMENGICISDEAISGEDPQWLLSDNDGTNSSSSSLVHPEQNSFAYYEKDCALKSLENRRCECAEANCTEDPQRLLCDNDEASSSSDSAKGEGAANLEGDDDSEPVDPEEAAFLKSLGWDENELPAELTQEEIQGFYNMHGHVEQRLLTRQRVQACKG